MAEIGLPPLGETVDEGTIRRWHKQPGDKVAVDEPIFEVETDKVVSDVPSPVAGELTEILVPEGATVSIGTSVAIVRTDDDEEPDLQPEPAVAPQGRDADGETSALVTGDSPEGVGGGPSRPERLAPRMDPRVRSPLVRRLLKDYELDPAELSGTGHGGRITRRDVMAFVKDNSLSAGDLRPAAPRGGDAQSTPAAEAGVERIPFTNVRRITAEHMVRSQATSAHTLTIVEVDYEPIARLREEVGPQFKSAEGFSLTYLPFIIRATVDALREFPRLNASVGDDELIVHRNIHLGIAVALGLEGLVVPVIRNVENLRLRAIAQAIGDLSSRARSRRLGVDELRGGTFTVTNPGGYGTFAGAAIINQPQVAIINVDGISKQPVVVEQPRGPDAVAIHRVGHLSMSWDHRAVDGVYAAAFLDLLRSQLESHDWAKEL